MIEDIFRHIDSHADSFVHDLRRLCRQPSISAQGVGLDACADLLVAQMQSRGIAAVLEPVPDGPPLVCAEVPGERPSTLLMYNHYDVQPPELLDEWDFTVTSRGSSTWR